MESLSELRIMVGEMNEVVGMRSRLRMEDHYQRSQDPPKITIKMVENGLEEAREGGFWLEKVMRTSSTIVK